MAAPWLYVTGFLLAFSALLTKTIQIRLIMKHPDFDIITITSLDILRYFLIVFSVNCVVMVAWTLHAPLRWTRTFTDSTDLFDRKVESFGRCVSEDSNASIAYVVTLIALNISALVVANYWSYRARHMETEYEESKYIGISLAAVLQAWGMGIPILVVVGENPQAKYFVETGIIFVTSVALLGLIFVPKMLAVKQDRIRAMEESRKNLYASFRDRQRNNDDEMEEEEDGDAKLDEKPESKPDETIATNGISTEEPSSQEDEQQHPQDKGEEKKQHQDEEKAAEDDTPMEITEKTEEEKVEPSTSKKSGKSSRKGSFKSSLKKSLTASITGAFKEDLTSSSFAEDVSPATKRARSKGRNGSVSGIRVLKMPTQEDVATSFTLGTTGDNAESEE